MDLMDLLGILGFAVGGSIVFFALGFVVTQAQSTAVDKTLLASFMSVFAFLGFVLTGFGLYFIFKSAARNEKQS